MVGSSGGQCTGKPGKPTRPQTHIILPTHHIIRFIIVCCLPRFLNWTKKGENNSILFSFCLIYLVKRLSCPYNCPTCNYCSLDVKTLMLSISRLFWTRRKEEGGLLIPNSQGLCDNIILVKSFAVGSVCVYAGIVVFHKRAILKLRDTVITCTSGLGCFCAHLYISVCFHAHVCRFRLCGYIHVNAHCVYEFVCVCVCFEIHVL